MLLILQTGLSEHSQAVFKYTNPPFYFFCTSVLNRIAFCPNFGILYDRLKSDSFPSFSCFLPVQGPDAFLLTLSGTSIRDCIAISERKTPSRLQTPYHCLFLPPYTGHTRTPPETQVNQKVRSLFLFISSSRSMIVRAFQSHSIKVSSYYFLFCFLSLFH